MKKSTAGTAIAAVLISALIPAAVLADDGVTVQVNGKDLDTEAVIINDRTYVPLRAVSEALGAEVSWDNDSRTVGIAAADESAIPSVINSACESVVAVVGNYKPGYTETAVNYKDSMAHGTGVIIRSAGLILTNAHVVTDIDNLTVIFRDGSEYAGTVQWIDKTADLAVVKINKLGLTPITFGTADDIVWGSTVIAIGTPLSLSMRNTVTRGIISGTDVYLSDAYYPLIQIDAAINAGNSGGPLITAAGKLIGINSSKYAGVGIEGMAFSIPVDTITYVLDQFDRNGKVLRPDIGITTEDSWEAKRGLPTTKGITVKTSTSSVLAVGDVITAVNGAEIHSTIEYNKVLRDTYTTGDISVTYTRGNSSDTVNITPELK